MADALGLNDIPTGAVDWAAIHNANRTRITAAIGAQQTITCGANVTIDWSLGATAYMLFDRASVEFTHSNMVLGVKYHLVAKQAAGGNGAATWADTHLWKGGSAPTLTVTANHVDMVTFVKTTAGIVAYADLNFY
jgi:hypothetical protein